MTISLRIDGVSEIGRQCGECQLCCKLVPVKEIAKRAGERCSYQRFGKGCVIYANRPMSCRVWSCVWFTGSNGEPVPDLRRPDRSHYVIDPMPDFVTGVDQETGEHIRIDVVQVWLDPRFPDCHRDPALRAYLSKRVIPGIMRTGYDSAWLLFPPEASPTGEWWERPFSGDDIMRPEHSIEEILHPGE